MKKHISLALNTCFLYLWNMWIWWICACWCCISGYVYMDMYWYVCILGSTYRTWICSWLQLDLGVVSWVSWPCQGAESPGGARWWGAGWLWTLGLKFPQRKSRFFETEIGHKNGEIFTTWQVLMLSGSVFMSPKMGHLHQRNLIVHT